MKPAEASLHYLFQLGVCLHNFNKQAQKMCGLSVVQWRLLKALVDMPATSAQSLARAVGIHPSTLTQSLKRLHKQKYIFITRDPHNCKRLIIAITRLGRNTLSVAQIKLQRWVQESLLLKTSLQQLKQHAYLEPFEGLSHE